MGSRLVLQWKRQTSPRCTRIGRCCCESFQILLLSEIVIPKQAERSLKLWESGALIVPQVRISQTLKRLKITFIPQVSDRGDETTGFANFSADNWGKATLKYLISVNELTTEEMEGIIAASRVFANTKGSSALAVASDDEDDPRGQLVMRAGSLGGEEETMEDGESEEVEIISGWGAIPKAFQDIASSSDNEAVEIEDTPAPKKKHKASLLISDKASSSTHNVKCRKVQKGAT